MRVELATIVTFVISFIYIHEISCFNQTRLRVKRDTSCPSTETTVLNRLATFTDGIIKNTNLIEIFKKTASGLAATTNLIDGFVAKPQCKIMEKLEEILKKLDALSIQMKDIVNQIKCELKRDKIETIMKHLSTFSDHFKSAMATKNFDSAKEQCLRANSGIRDLVDDFKNYVRYDLEHIVRQCGRYNRDEIVRFCLEAMFVSFSILNKAKSCEEVLQEKTNFDSGQFIEDLASFMRYFVDVVPYDDFFNDATDLGFSENVKTIVGRFKKADEANKELDKKYPQYNWAVVYYSKDVRGFQNHAAYTRESPYCGSDHFIRTLKNGLNALVGWCVPGMTDRNVNFPKITADRKANAQKVNEEFKNANENFNFVLTITESDEPSFSGFGRFDAHRYTFTNALAMKEKFAVYRYGSKVSGSDPSRPGKPSFGAGTTISFSGSSRRDRPVFIVNQSGQDGSKESQFRSARCNRRLVGYYPSWGTRKFNSEQASILTHAVFAFFQMFSDGRIELGDPNPVDDKSGGQTAQERLDNFKSMARKHPHLKTLFAIGGWENSQYFSNVAQSASLRARLIKSIIEVIDEHGFDGVDIDWEYPVTGGATEGVAQDKQNFVVLVRELRAAFKNYNPDKHYLITFAGAAGQWTLDPGYDLPGLLEYVDFINVMTYDYFGAWESKWGANTGTPSPLYYGNPKGFSGKMNVDWTMKYYVCKSKQPNKITMGVPFYGRYWENVGDAIDGNDPMWRLAQPVNGKFIGGFKGWREIKSKYLGDSNFVHKRHQYAKTPFAWNEKERIFLGYEDPESLLDKMDYAERHNLGGIMIWAIDLDDDENTMMKTLRDTDLCQIEDPNAIVHRCLPIDEKRWWTPEDTKGNEGMCGKSAPLYNGYYPICDPEDPGYKCCGAAGFCGSGSDYCNCPTCVDYGFDYSKINQEPVKPTTDVNWYFSNAPDGKRGRCGRGVPTLNGVIPICNPDDPNAHCCSNGGYCGTGAEFCDCKECVDFKKRPNYRFKEKTWWDWSDGPQLSGKCGPNAPKINGKEAECNPDSDFPCCSRFGSCGNGPQFCDCNGCRKF